jgi:hypothetical protein
MRFAYTPAFISATNFFQPSLMRSRSLSRNTDGLGWGLWLGLGILLLVILGAGALVIYAGRIQPPSQHSIDQVLTHDPTQH